MEWHNQFYYYSFREVAQRRTLFASRRLVARSGDVNRDSFGAWRRDADDRQPRFTGVRSRHRRLFTTGCWSASIWSKRYFQYYSNGFRLGRRSAWRAAPGEPFAQEPDQANARRCATSPRTSTPPFSRIASARPSV
ncbi:hypothetical protein M8494_19840 [Serratia ureilytica]